MADFKNVKKKVTRLMGRFSETPDGITSEQTTVENVEGIFETSSYVVADCGHAFKPGEVKQDEWTGMMVCSACLKECATCGKAVWVKRTIKVGDSYLCPDCKFSGLIKLGINKLGRKEK